MKNTEIAWTNHTFNPWIGCTKVSPGCANCYAENETFARIQRSRGNELWGKGRPRMRTSETYWKQPIHWNRQHLCFYCGGKTYSFTVQDFKNAPTEAGRLCPKCNQGVQTYHPRVFCGSMCDWLDDESPIEWLVDLLELIRATPNLDWQLLTKRPENFNMRINAAIDHAPDDLALWLQRWGEGTTIPNNVWIGTTVENQEMADLRIPQLLAIPSKIRFLSIEPLLGPVDLNTSEKSGPMVPIDWVIVGGESGNKARPMNVAWVESLLDQCRDAEVPIFVKQMGDNCQDQNDAGFEVDYGQWPMDTHYTELDHGYQGAPVRIKFKTKAGRNPDEWPESLRIRQFPKT